MFERRHPEINDAFIGMNFGRAKSEFCRIRLAGTKSPGEHVLEFRVIVDELQQWLTTGSVLAYPQQVFGGGIQFGDQEILVEQNHACV